MRHHPRFRSVFEFGCWRVEPTHETRQQMIDSTNRFLSAALRHRGPLPRIARRRVDEGGFATMLRRPEARAMVAHWWHRVLSCASLD